MLLKYFRYLNILVVISIILPIWGISPITNNQPPIQQISDIDGNGWQCWDPDIAENPCHLNITSYSIVSSNDSWAVGQDGFILHWNGNVWNRVANQTTNSLRSIFMLSSNDGWIVGSEGVILHWDGSVWNSFPSPVTDDLTSVSMLSSTDGWAVGVYGLILHWDGSVWNKLTSPVTDHLHSISMLSSTDGWVVGDNVILHWDGSVWSKVICPIPAFLNSSSFVSSTDGWAVGFDSVILHWDGSIWSEVVSPITYDLSSISMLSSTDGWAVGAGGVILHWDGSMWSVVVSQSSYYLNSISMLSSTDGWAVGGNGLILHWDGSVWSSIINPNAPLIVSISMLSSTDGWAAGYDDRYTSHGGVVLHWNGSDWNIASHLTGGILRSIFMLTPTDGWVVGDYGVIFHWDGSGWSSVVSPVPYTLWSISMLSSTDGWAVGDSGVILHWDGSTWNSLTSPSSELLNSVFMLSSTDGWAGGFDGVFHWDGSVWSSVAGPNGDYISLSMISPIDGWASSFNFFHWNGSVWSVVGPPLDTQIWSISTVSSNDVWAVGISGDIFHWDGVSWSIKAKPSSSPLWSISMVSATDGWAGGWGTILKYEDKPFHVEINQVLGRQFGQQQNYVAGKPTAIRVLLNSPVSVNPSTQFIVVKRNGNTVIKLYPELISSSQTDVLTFQCPTFSDCGFWAEGNYEFDVYINSVTAREIAVFQPRRGLRLLAVPITVSGSMQLDNQWQTAQLFLRQAYPVAYHAVIWIPDFSGVNAVDLNLRNGNDQQELIRRLLKKQPKGCGGPDNPCYDMIVGFIPPMDLCNDHCEAICSCSLGFSTSNPNMPVAVIMSNGEFYNSCAKKYEFVDEMRAAVAHEYGHILQLGEEYNRPWAEYNCAANPPPKEYIGWPWLSPVRNKCNPQFSCVESNEFSWPSELHSGSGSLIKSEESHPFELFSIIPGVPARGALQDSLSFMGNGKYQKDIWITPKTYSYLFSQFSPQANQQWVNTADERVLHISGEIGQDDSIRIDPWYSFMSTPETPVTGTYTINAVDSLGQIVATQGFDISFEILSNSPVETEYALFSTVINFPQNTTAFRIMHDDTVLLAVPVSVNIPSIQVLSPNGGESWPISGDQVVSWEANDLDGDILFYSAEYTPDGINWTVLAADITSTQITVNTAFLAGGNAARVKIVATDGVNTSVDESDGTFMVGKKNPQIFIISPSDNFSIQPGLSFSLQAYGYDLEDGEFDDAAYHWTSDRDGDLGNGFLRHVSLSPGKHNITLTVTDKDGNQAAASVTIFIGYQQYLPFAIKQ